MNRVLGQNRDTDIEKGCVDMMRGSIGEGGMNWEIRHSVRLTYVHCRV